MWTRRPVSPMVGAAKTDAKLVSSCLRLHFSASRLGAGDRSAMDKQRCDPMTAAPISGTGRRRAIAGLLAGTAAVLSQGLDALARRRKKKDRCVHCPQTACCACASSLMTSTRSAASSTPRATMTSPSRAWPSAARINSFRSSTSLRVSPTPAPPTSAASRAVAQSRSIAEPQSAIPGPSHHMCHPARPSSSGVAARKRAPVRLA